MEAQYERGKSLENISQPQQSLDNGLLSKYPTTSAPEMLALQNREHKIIGTEIIVKICPLCHPGTDDPSNQWKLNIRRDDGVYFCHRCKASGIWNRTNSNAGEITNNRQLEKCKELLAESLALNDIKSTISSQYLTSRGFNLSVAIKSLRHHPACPYFDNGESKNIKHFPALLGVVCDAYGELKGVQRIYLSSSGNKADVSDPKKSLGSLKGNSVHLGEPSTTLAVTEGIETGLAVMLATKSIVWAAVSALGMESLNIPDSVKKIYIWADLDKSATGLRAAEKLAARLKAEGRTAFVLLPEGPIPDGQKSLDWLDVFNIDQSILVAALKRSQPFTLAVTQELPPIIEHVSWPSPIASEAFHGLAGNIIRLIEPHTEADPVALLVQLIVAFGNVIGRNAYYSVESTRHYLNLFTVLVGDTAKGRKGTSLDHIVSLFRQIAPDWCKNNIISGLSTGEGLIHHVRDRIERTKAVKNRETGEMETITDIIDEGVTDKRVFVIEPEFSSVLRITSRDGNTLSAITREAWDRGDLRTLTKNSPERATGAHISIAGHITSHELRRYLSETEALNGYGNRFLWACVRRSKLLPFGGKLKASDLDSCRFQLERAIQFGSTVGEVTFAPDAMQAWVEVYKHLADAKPGLFGSMTARAEAQVVRLSSVYAVMNGSALIKPEHLMAALALWEYCEDSCRYIFGNSLGDLIADRILEALRTNQQGITRTDIRELFHGKQSAARVEQALALLVQYKLAKSNKESTSGRPIEWWFAVRRDPSAKRVERAVSFADIANDSSFPPLEPLTRPGKANKEHSRGQLS